jgi:hypothetical protein
MDKLNKYYIETLKKIDTLIKDQQWEEAFEIVAQEIASPYIPAEYMERFEQLYVELNKIVMVNHIKERYHSMTKMEMLAKTYDGRRFDVNLFSYLIGKFYEELDQIDLQYINKIFSDKHLANAEKIFALEQLKLAGISYTFDFFNNVLNKTFAINTLSDFEYNKHRYFKTTKQQIDNILLKNPSLATLSNELLLIIYEYYFGNQPPYDSLALAEKLTAYVQTYFDKSYKPDGNFKL